MGAGGFGEGRPRGGQRGRAAPRVVQDTGPARELTLRLAGHGAAGPGAETDAGAGDSGAEAVTATAPRAARVALPRALRLRPGRRPALPRPSRRPLPTVSTWRPTSLPLAAQALSPFSAKQGMALHPRKLITLPSDEDPGVWLFLLLPCSSGLHFPRGGKLRQVT